MLPAQSPRYDYVLPGSGGRLRRALGRLSDVTQSALGPPEPARGRQDVIRRALVAGVIMAVLPIQGLRIPGWPAVVAGCGVAIAYDVILAYLVFAKQRFMLAQVLGLLLDAAVLMVASWYVFAAMGAASSTSDIWLVFLVYIITGGFTLAPAGSILYTAVWTGWFALCTILLYEPGSQFREQLPIRLIFFGTIGLISLGMASELEKRRARLEQQNRQTVGMLATLVEARDTDAGAHLQHIQYFSRALAVHMGFSDRDAQEIAYASMVHDVGKANVPDAILKKPGPLSSEEWAVMEQHTDWGDSLLMNNSDFEVARQVARWHHEHWDGTGYPDKLAGEAIPLAARIVAVADVFDALISTRPYKDAWPVEAAVLELRRLAGSHLDPEIVAAFLELWDAGVIQDLAQQIEEDESAGALPRAA